MRIPPEHSPRTIDLGFRETADSVSDDLPTHERCLEWASSWEKGGEEKAGLILRHMVYARNQLERMLGAELTLIELVHLRRITEAALRRTIYFAQHADRDRAYDAGLLPTREAIAQFIEECMGVPWHLYNQYQKLDKDGIDEYLRRTHARLNHQI